MLSFAQHQFGRIRPKFLTLVFKTSITFCPPQMLETLPDASLFCLAL